MRKKFLIEHTFLDIAITTNKVLCETVVYEESEFLVEDSLNKN